MRRSTSVDASRSGIVIAGGLLFAGLLAAGGAGAEKLSDGVAAPGACAESRVKLRGSPIALLPEQPAPDDEPAVPGSDPGSDPEQGDGPLPPLSQADGPAATPTPPGDPDDGGPRGGPTPTSPPPSGPGSRAPFDVAGGPRQHFDPTDVGSNAVPESQPRPEAPPFTPRSCDIPGVCSGPLSGPVSIISEPKPTPLPGDPFPR